MHQHRDTAACRFANLVPPVVSLHGDNGNLGYDDGSSDGNGYPLGAFTTKTNMTMQSPITTKVLKLVGCLPLHWHIWTLSRDSAPLELLSP